MDEITTPPDPYEIEQESAYEIDEDILKDYTGIQ